MEWFYVDRNRKTQGPLEIEELVALFRASAIGGETLIWTRDMAGWSPAKTCEEFFRELRAMPKPSVTAAAESIGKPVETKPAETAPPSSAATSAEKTVSAAAPSVVEPAIEAKDFVPPSPSPSPAISSDPAASQLDPLDALEAALAEVLAAPAPIAKPEAKSVSETPSPPTAEAAFKPDAESVSTEAAESGTRAIAADPYKRLYGTDEGVFSPKGAETSRRDRPFFTRWGNLLVGGGVAVLVALAVWQFGIRPRIAKPISVPQASKQEPVNPALAPAATPEPTPAPTSAPEPERATREVTPAVPAPEEETQKSKGKSEAITMLPPLSPAEEKRQQMFDEEVARLKPSLPLKVDAVTTLISVSHLENSLMYFFELKIDKSETDARRFETEMKKQIKLKVCGEANKREAMEAGGTIDYFYRDKNAAPLAMISFRAGDCR